MLVVIGGPAISAALASSDVPTPAGAERLAEDIRDWFPRKMQTSFLAYRVAIRDWDERGDGYLVHLEVHSPLFGFAPRTGYAIAGCDWEQSPSPVSFEGGWADTEGDLALVLDQWATLSDSCP